MTVSKAFNKSKDAGFGRSTVDKKGKSTSKEVSLSKRTKHCFFHDGSSSINQLATKWQSGSFQRKVPNRGLAVGSLGIQQ